MATAPAPRSPDEPPPGEPDPPPEQYPDMVLLVNGAPHELWIGELSGRDISVLRRWTGKSLQMLALELATGQGDLDVFAAYLFLARRQRGETDLKYDDVLDGLHYKDETEYLTLGEDRDRIVELYPDGPPEAPGAAPGG